MIIQELKPSKRVRGRWLAVLEDGSILRVGEGEVLQFSLCAGRELTEEAAKYRGFVYKEYQAMRMRNKTHPPARPEDAVTISHYAISD